MKRFRVRPYRSDTGLQFWAIGPDVGRTAPLRSVHLGQTPGEVIDRQLSKGKANPFQRVIPRVTFPDGSGRSEMYVRRHKKPPYPEH